MSPHEAQRLRSEIEAARKNAEQQRAWGRPDEAAKWDRRADELQRELDGGSQ